MGGPSAPMRSSPQVGRLDGWSPLPQGRHRTPPIGRLTVASGRSGALPDRSPGVLEVTDPAALAPAVLKRERVASRGSQPQALFVDDEEGRKHEAVRVENPSELGQVMHDVVFEHVREHRLEDDQIDSAVLDRILTSSALSVPDGL
jgi:hypothetical protein